MTNKRTPWELTENEALIRLYFSMLERATTGQPYNKAAMIRAAQNGVDGISGTDFERDWLGFAGQLAGRSRGSIEAKLMNATACHRDELPDDETMDGHGYRALPNYQSHLRHLMRRALIARRCHREVPAQERGA